jgi:hypothetical protein
VVELHKFISWHWTSLVLPIGNTFAVRYIRFSTVYLLVADNIFLHR